MTSDSTIFDAPTILSTSHVVHAANNSTMHIKSINTIQTCNLSLPNTLLVLKLSLNLIFVGQLYELGVNLLILSHGYTVQDPQTGKILGVGRKIG